MTKTYLPFLMAAAAAASLGDALSRIPIGGSGRWYQSDVRQWRRRRDRRGKRRRRGQRP